MLPNYIQNELMRRLSPERALIMAKSVGLDPDQPLPPLDPQFVQRREFNGNLQFDLTVGALGHCMSIPCRLSFSVDLIDDVDAETGKPIRIVGRAQEMLHALIPTGEANPVFEWASIPHRLLPPAAASKLDDQVEELARIMEDSRPRGR